MKLSTEPPPNIAELEQHFGVSFERGPLELVVTYGETVHVRSGRLAPDLVVHEQVHIKQQTDYPGGPVAWWQRYFADVGFRLAQETEAYQAQAAWIRKWGRSRDERFRMIEHIWRSMATQYGSMINYHDAQKLIPLQA